MFVDPSKVPPRWVCNAPTRGDPVATFALSLYEHGPPAQVHDSWPVERLKAEGYIGIYKRRQPLPPVRSEVKAEVKRIVDDAASFDDLDLFGEGK
jgi:hypothetical protein